MPSSARRSALFMATAKIAGVAAGSRIFVNIRRRLLAARRPAKQADELAAA